MKKQKLILNGILTTYLTSDNFYSQKSLLFLHGRGQNKESFEKIYLGLDKSGVSYVGLDLPGFGGSDFPKSDFTIFDYSNFTKDFIEKLGLNNPILVGHSFGGRICIILGSSFENINKIVLIGSAGIKPKINKGRLIITKMGKVIFSLPGLKGIGKKIKSKLGSEDYKNSGLLKQIFLQTIRQDLIEYLPKIKYKTLLIWGENDLVTPLRDGELMNKLILNSKLITYKDGTHFVFQELSDEVTVEILDFIK